MLIVDATQVNAAGEVNAASIATTDSAAATMIINEVTLAQALMEIKSTKPKAKGIVFQEPKELVKLKKKDQITLDEEVRLKLQAELQAELDKEQRLASEKDQQQEDANITLIETWDDVQAKIDADYQLAERLQAEEQQELNDAEKATLFMKLLEKRRKFFAAKRGEEKRNRPPTRAQQRSIMCTYLKNMEGWKPNSLKNKSFAKIQELFGKAIKKAQEEMGEDSANPTDPHYTPTIIQPFTSQPQNTKQPRKPRRNVTEVPQLSDPIEHVADMAVNEEMDDSLERAATTATSLDVEQDKGVNTPQSREDSLKLTELMELCTKLQQRVLDLENGDEVIVGSVDVAEQAKKIVDDITLAKALMEIKSAKPKALKVAIQEPEQGTTTTTPTIITVSSSRPKAKGLVIHEQEQAPTPTGFSQQPSQFKDKGKGKMVEPKPVKKLLKKYQLMLDEELAFKLQAKKEEEERLAIEKA
nr:hypothetical protein [Tanacetum cinerariifolium]